MSNPYINHYINQIGGLQGFSGVRYQRGHGFFSRLFSGVGSFVKDLLPSLGKRALPSAIGLAQDVLSGENVGRSAKKRLIEAGRGVADETLDKLKSRVQGGSGINALRRFKRKGRVIRKKVNKRRKKHRKTRK